MGFVLVARSKLTTKNAAISGLIYMFCECAINITKIKHKNTLLTNCPVKRVHISKSKYQNQRFLFIYFVSRSKSPTKFLTLYRRCYVLLLLHNPVKYKSCHNYCNSYYISEKCRMNKHKSACRNNNTGNHVHSCEAVALKS